MSIESIAIVVMLFLDSATMYLVFTYNPRGVVNRFLGLMLVLIALMDLGALILATTDGIAPGGPRRALGLYGFLLFLALAFHLSFYYPRRRRASYGTALCLVVYAAAAVLGTALTAATWNTEGFLATMVSRAPLLARIPFISTMLLASGLLVAMASRFISSLSLALTARERRTLIMVALGFLVLSVSMVLNPLIFESSRGDFWLLYCESASHTLFFVCLAASFGFFDRRVVFRLFVAYPLIIGALATISLIGLCPMNRYLERALSVDRAVFLGAEAVLVITLVLPLIKAALHFAEGKLFPSIVDFRSAISGVQVAIAGEIDIERFCQAVVSFFVNDLKVRQALFFFAHDGVFVPYRPFRDGGGASGGTSGDLAAVFDGGGGFVSTLEARRVLTVREFAQESTDRTELEALERLKCAIAVALGANDSVDGFLLLGADRSGTWDSAEKAELEILSVGLSLAFERCMSHSRAIELERKQASIEKMAAMSELIGGVAHEIRNPLSIIAASAERLENPLSSPDERLKCAGYVREEAERLSGILDVMLSSFSPRFEFDHRSVDVVPVLSRVLDMLGARFRSRRIAVSFSGADSARAIIDKEALTQVCLNLFLNASEFSGEGGDLTVLVDDAAIPGRVVIDVRNSGDEIPPELRQRIFEPFFTTRSGGTGLGLPVSRRLLRSAGGDLSYIPDEGGNIFRMLIPKGAER